MMKLDSSEQRRRLRHEIMRASFFRRLVSEKQLRKFLRWQVTKKTVRKIGH
jgi:hypothetical protein